MQGLRFSRTDAEPIAKVRILTEQTSPETLSWDNPFPTFPTKSKKMPQPSEADAPRPATASSNRSHDCAREQPRLRKGDRSTDDDRQPPLHDVRSDYTTAPISGLPPNIPRPVLEGARGFPMQLNAPSAQYAQASGEGMAGGNRPLRNGIPHLEANLKESHSVPASPWQSKYTPGIRNNVNSPSEIPEPMSHSSLPFRDNEHAVQQERDPRDQRGPPSNHNELHQRREEHHPRSTDTNRSQSLDLDRGYQGQIGQTYKPFPGPFATPDETNNRHLGSYHDWSNESQQMQYPQEARNNRSPGESDIPNFDALTNERAYQRPGMMMDQQLHLQPQTNPANTSSFKDGNGHGAQREQPVASNFSSQASRSRSQPNYKDRRHPNYAHGFEASNLTPPVAAFNGQSPMPHYNSGYMDPPPSQSQERPYYGTKQHSNISQRSFVKQQGTPQSPSHGLPVLQPTRSPDDRNEYPSASGSPANSFSPGISRGPTSPPHIDRPRLNPPIERVYASSASSMDLNRPDSIQSRRLSNPDSLPAHPAPIRPGLVSPPNSNQPKPPPVRQYNNISSPVLQSNVPQSQLRRSIGNADSRPVTHEELQRLQQAVKVNPNDQKTQLLLAQKMVEAASVLADEGGRADAKTRNKNREKYIFDAHKLVKKLVSGGYTEAMFYLADCHGSGLLGLQPDPKEAFSLYQSAAKLGHAPSAYRVAVCCEMGQEDGGGTRRDPLKAVQWYKRAATLGDTPAMYKMGMIQLKGLLGQPKNMRESIVWLKRAADHADAENPHALHELVSPFSPKFLRPRILTCPQALLYESASPNDNIIRDEAYSAQLLLQAAELGYKFSQYRLGAAFEYGHLGRPIDPRQSIAWYSKAAVQEEHQSELALSGWYLTGSEGVLQQSDTEAYLWARKAAQAGLAKAEYAMGYFTEVGIGASANMDDAKRWYWRAACTWSPCLISFLGVRLC